MKQIFLHGVLAEKFGKVFTLDVKTAREATHAIASQIPEFKAFMLSAEKIGLKFAVFLGEQNIGENQVDAVTDQNHIHIVPKVMGAGGKLGGWLQVIGGAILVGVGMTVPGMQWAVGAGYGMMIGGVASLLMPMPKMDTEQPDGNRPNYGFGGAVTTVAQGNPVPVLYGERDVGGFVCSAGIYTEDKA